MSNDGHCGRCYEAYLVKGGASRDEESWCFPVDDFVDYEKLEYGSLVFAHEHLRKIYDYELDFDAHPSAQLRVTQRAMYRQRIGIEEREPRLAELQRLLAGTATVAEAEDLLDQLRYVFWDQMRYEDREWCESEAAGLRRRLATTSASFQRTAAEDCLELVEAEIEALDLCGSLEGKAESWLDARRAVLHQTLLPFEADTMDLDISQVGLVALAIKICEARADIRRHNVEVAEHTKANSMHTESDRLGKLRLRLRTLETNGERYRMRKELRLIESFLDSAREPRQCPLCKGRQPNVRFRHKSIICYCCEFPKCAACSRQREEAEGPLHKGKHKEALVLKPWYLVRHIYM